jgi:L-malate glycosyltransferase
MRVAVLAPEFLPTWGGAGTYAVELVRNLCKDKTAEIHVITPERGRGYDPEAVAAYFNGRITLHNISKANDTFFYNFAFQTALLRDFSRLNREHGFDLVHATSLVHMPDIFLKFRRQQLPALTTVHTTLKSQTCVNGQTRLSCSSERSSVERMTGLVYPYIHMMEKQYLKRTSNLITVSDWIKGFIDEEAPGKNIRVIHNGVDTDKFAPSGAGIAQDSGPFANIKAAGKPIVLYCGRLMALKGLKVLIDSIPSILAEQPAHFVFAGTGDIPAWERLLRAQGVSKDNYTFLGYVRYEQIHELYHMADIFVLPTYTDSCPLTILEAMSTQLPIVASDVGGVSELIRPGKDGILVPPGDSARLSAEIIMLLQSNHTRKKLAASARARAVAEFDSAMMARRTKRFYKAVIGEA